MAVPLAFRWLLSFISGIISWIWKLPHQQPENAQTTPANPLENLNNGGVNSSPTETEEYAVGMSELQFSMANENQHVSMDSGFSSVMSADVVSISHSSLDNMDSPNNGGCGGGAQAGGGGQDGPGNGGGKTSGGAASRDEGGSSGGGSAGSGGDGRRPPAGNLAVPAEDVGPDSTDEDDSDTQSPGASAPHHQPPTSHQVCPDNDNPVYRAGGNPRVVLPQQMPGSDNGADRAGMVSTQGTGAPTAPPRETQLRIRNGLHLAEYSQERGRARVDETIDMRPAESAMSLRDGATLAWPESEDIDDGEDYPDIDMADRRAGIVTSSNAAQPTTENLFVEEGSSRQDTGRRRVTETTQALSRTRTVHVSPRDTDWNLDRPPESVLEEGASNSSQDMSVKKRKKNAKDKTSAGVLGGPLCKLCDVQRSDMALHPCRCCLCQTCCLRYLGERRMIGRFSRDPCPDCGQDVHRAFDIAQSG